MWTNYIKLIKQQTHRYISYNISLYIVYPHSIPITWLVNPDVCLSKCSIHYSRYNSYSHVSFPRNLINLSIQKINVWFGF